jgi:crotonobetainyl-CoA:carnitine CoA-transferase CaiB-like acyl-CoA transferase
LKHPEGKEVLKRLVVEADVLVENFRPGVMDRLAFGYDTLSQIKPSLVYCAISGFGREGPFAQRPAYDQIIQGASGVMSITGDTASAPLRVGSYRRWRLSPICWSWQRARLTGLSRRSSRRRRQSAVDRPWAMRVVGR